MQIYITYNKYLCLLRHIIMMHFGNGDKPNGCIKSVERTACIAQGHDNVTCVFLQGAEDGSFPEELWLTSARWTPNIVWTFLNWRRTLGASASHFDIDCKVPLQRFWRYSVTLIYAFVIMIIIISCYKLAACFRKYAKIIAICINVALALNALQAVWRLARIRPYPMWTLPCSPHS